MMTPEITTAVAQEVANIGLDESAIFKLRQSFEGIHFTYCMDDDIAENAKPVIEETNFNLYLVDGREHCLCLTNDYGIATGIVLAEVLDEE